MKNLFFVSAAAGLTLMTGAAFAQMSDVDLKSEIKAQGYSNITITEHEKTHVDFTATKGGKKVKMAADINTGKVMADSDKDDDDVPKKR